MAEVLPSEVVMAAKAEDLASFCRRFDDRLLLVVRVMDGEPGQILLHTLGSTLDGARTASLKPVAMQFHTEWVRPEDLQRSPPSVPPMSGGASASVIRWLSTGTHYVARLRKREGADSSYARRVSVGRATNKDIVLRHSTVSKFHAWFEVDESGEVYVADAGSKNGSTVRGEELFPREPVAVHPGDTVAFGSVESLLCSPRDLWKVIRR